MPTIPNPPYHTPDHNNPGWLEWFRTHKHRPVTKFIYPTSLSVVVGTLTSGTVANLATLDVTPVTITEVSGTPGFSVNVNFSAAAIGNKKPIGVVTRCYYDGTSTHDVFVGAYDYRNVAITRTHTIPTGNAYWRDLSWEFPDPTYFCSTTTGCTVRFEHPSGGVPGHILRIDYCALMYLEDE